MRTTALAFVLIASSLASAQESQSLRGLRDDLRAIVSDSTISNSFVGIDVMSLKTGEPLFSENAGRDFVPASNMKLLTTSTVLSLLGPDFTFHTSLMAYGYVLNDTLFGDLYVRGSGDPTISGRFTGGNVVSTFQAWADTLKLLDIKVVKGNIIGDDRCFDDARVGGGWSLDWHEDIYWYAARISGLSFNDNCVDLTLRPGTVGEPVSISYQPHTSYVSFVNTSVTVNDTINTLDFYRDPGTNLIHVFGNFPANLDSMKVSLTVSDPTSYTVAVLKNVLESSGIVVAGNAEGIRDLKPQRTFPPYSVMWEIAGYTSPPLSEIIKVVNKRSQNFYAEQLFRTLGMEKYGLGSFAYSRIVEEKFLASVGLDTTRIEIADGSGLSSWDLVSPADIVKILTAMDTSRYRQYFYDSLPIAGVDGTLQYRMKGTVAEGNLRGKTGYVENVRSLSGYVSTRDGEPLVFSMFFNHFTVPVDSVSNLQDSICIRLANFSRR